MISSLKCSTENISLISWKNFFFFCLISFTLKYPMFFTVWKNCVIKIFRFERKVRFTGKWTQIDVSINKTLNLLENSADNYSVIHMVELIFRKQSFAQKFYSFDHMIEREAIIFNCARKCNWFLKLRQEVFCWIIGFSLRCVNVEK